MLFNSNNIVCLIILVDVEEKKKASNKEAKPSSPPDTLQDTPPESAEPKKSPTEGGEEAPSKNEGSQEEKKKGGEKVTTKVPKTKKTDSATQKKETKSKKKKEAAPEADKADKTTHSKGKSKHTKTKDVAVSSIPTLVLSALNLIFFFCSSPLQPKAKERKSKVPKETTKSSNSIEAKPANMYDTLLIEPLATVADLRDFVWTCFTATPVTVGRNPPGAVRLLSAPRGIPRQKSPSEDIPSLYLTVFRL